MSDSNSLKVPFFKPSFTKEEEDAVVNVIRSGWLTTGKESLAFEKEFAQKINVPYALSVNSNTSGMILAMEACGVKPGKAVITTPYTFVSTATSARHLGGDVYFADIEKDSYNIDPVSIEKILTSEKGKNVVAIVPVHIAGNVCNMNEIMRIAKKYNVKVIEDCAHSFPSKTKMGYAGAIGDIGVFSFYVTKTITTGEGGMCTTKDENLAKRMTIMRMHGMDRTTWDRYTSPRASWEYDIIEPGFKFNLPDVLAAIGRVQLKKADEFDIKRKRLADIYNKAFEKINYVKIPPTSEGNAWHLYLMRLDLTKLTCSRDDFAKELQQMGVGISLHFIPLFHFTYWQKYDSTFSKDLFPNAESHYIETITLPLWPEMSDQDINFVIDCVKEVGNKYRV